MRAMLRLALASLASLALVAALAAGLAVASGTAHASVARTPQVPCSGVSLPC